MTTDRDDATLGVDRSSTPGVAAEGAPVAVTDSDGWASSLVQVGWVKFDGDEFHDFTYFAADDREKHRAAQIMRDGYVPVYAVRQDYEGTTDD